MPSVPTRPEWARLLMAAVVWALAAAAVLAAIPVLFGSPQPMVHIQWRNISAFDRSALERQFRLAEPTELSTDEWSYVPADRSTDAMRAIVTHPSVEDTAGIDRRAFTISDSPPLTPRRGGLLGGTPPWMARGARALAYVLGCIAGVLLFRSALVSPLLGPGSAFRRVVRAQLTDPSSALRTVPAAAMARVRRRVTARAAETTVVIALFTAAVAWRFLTFTGFSNDHYAHLALAQQLLLGDRPIRDFADPGWPLTYLLTAAGWLVVGDSMATEWAIAAAGFALGAACTVAVGYRLSGSLAIAVLVTVFEILIYPRTYSYPKVLMYGVGAWAMFALAARPSRGRIVLMAAIVAIAFLFRHDHGLFIGVGSAVCLALASRADGWRIAAGRVARLTAAAAVFLLPWALFVALNGGLVAYFQAGLEYSRAEADATSLASWPALALGPARSAANADAWLFWLFWSLPPLCAGVAYRRLLRREERWPREFAVVAALAVLAILVNASFLRESLQVRLPDAVVPAALLGAWALGVCWIGRWRRRVLQVIVQLASLAIVAMSGVAVSRIAGLPEQYDSSGMALGLEGVRRQAREVSVLLHSPHRRDTPSRYSTALMPFFGYLDRCTTRADRLIVTAEFPDVLVLAGRRFAGDGVVFGSWYSSALHQDRTVAGLQARPTLFVLHMGDYATFRSRFALVDAYIDREYEPMAEVPVEDGGSIRILVQQSRVATGVDPATGWRCFR